MTLLSAELQSLPIKECTPPYSGHSRELILPRASNIKDKSVCGLVWFLNEFKCVLASVELSWPLQAHFTSRSPDAPVDQPDGTSDLVFEKEKMKQTYNKNV